MNNFLFFDSCLYSLLLVGKDIVTNTNKERRKHKGGFESQEERLVCKSIQVRVLFSPFGSHSPSYHKSFSKINTKQQKQINSIKTIY